MKIVAIIFFLLVGFQASCFAWPDTPSPDLLVAQPEMNVDDISREACLASNESNRNRIEVYRLSGETYRNNLEIFRTGVEEERRKTENERSLSMISTDIYFEKMKKYKYCLLEYSKGVQTYHGVQNKCGYLIVRYRAGVELCSYLPVLLP